LLTTNSNLALKTKISQRFLFRLHKIQSIGEKEILNIIISRFDKEEREAIQLAATAKGIL